MQAASAGATGAVVATGPLLMWPTCVERAAGTGRKALMSRAHTSEGQGREAWMALQRENLNDWRCEMRAAGWPVWVIERMAQLVE